MVTASLPTLGWVFVVILSFSEVEIVVLPIVLLQFHARVTHICDLFFITPFWRGGTVRRSFSH